MGLDKLHTPQGATSSRKRIGRGCGSGIGGTSGRGNKGQGSRTGASRKAGFEGGQMPLQRRIPKRGFYNIFSKKYVAVHLGDLARFEVNSVVDPIAMKEARLVHHEYDLIKILGDGELGKALTVRAQGFSASAKEKIESAGGKAEVIAALRKKAKQSDTR
jgi:large subunit ribosomal protein L15